MSLTYLLLHPTTVQPSCSVNVIHGEPAERQMTTGNHIVRDIYCCKCGTTLGWKYVRLVCLREFSFSTDTLPILYACRTRRSSRIRSTKRTSSSSSETSSPTSSSPSHLTVSAFNPATFVSLTGSRHPTRRQAFRQTNLPRISITMAWPSPCVPTHRHTIAR